MTRTKCPCCGQEIDSIDPKKNLVDATTEIESLVRDAFFEGFCEGRDGGWVWGDPTPAWERSDAIGELKK